MLKEGIGKMTEKQNHLCCAHCKWSGKMHLPLKPKRLEKEPLVMCTLHNFVVWSPELYFCTQFAWTFDFFQKTASDMPAEISDGFVYVWMDVSYRDLAAEDIMHSVQNIVPFATLDEYTQLTPTQKSVRYYRMYNSIFFDIERQLAPAKLMEEEMYQKKYLPFKRMQQASEEE